MLTTQRVLRTLEEQIADATCVCADRTVPCHVIIPPGFTGEGYTHAEVKVSSNA